MPRRSVDARTTTNAPALHPRGGSTASTFRGCTSTTLLTIIRTTSPTRIGVLSSALHIPDFEYWRSRRGTPSPESVTHWARHQPRLPATPPVGMTTANAARRYRRTSKRVRRSAGDQAGKDDARDETGSARSHPGNDSNMRVGRPGGRVSGRSYSTALNSKLAGCCYAIDHFVGHREILSADRIACSSDGGWRTTRHTGF